MATYLFSCTTSGVEAFLIDSGGNRENFSRIDTIVSYHVFPNRLSCCDDKIGEGVDEVQAGRIDRIGEVAGADELPAGEFGCEPADPGILAAVGIDDVDLFTTNDPHQAEKGFEIGIAPKRQREDGNPLFQGLLPDPGVFAAGQEGLHPPFTNGQHFVEDADLLSSPTVGPFGM